MCMYVPMRSVIATLPPSSGLKMHCTLRFAFTKINAPKSLPVFCQMGTFTEVTYESELKPQLTYDKTILMHAAMGKDPTSRV